MRITRLELTDYKSFESLVLDDLGSRVVLVGPNGCGKSSVLEAISVLKEFAGTYNTNHSFYNRPIPTKNIHGIGWPVDIPTPVRADRSNATISADFQFDATERAIAEVEAVSVTVQIERISGSV